MSNSHRDQRGRPHSGKKCAESRIGGCPHCHTGDQKVTERRKRRTRGKRLIRQGLADRD